ncbi:hypothetical protein F3Y22_tig00110198pilonHSYRG00046 [Hibiscus syriacus]|uniref:Jacalin-type lectin domain-containing protein n=1 Tax=Hibiscus syriacus TaxID=106335 RepID=A0A6A3BCF1_HIBSY|nr:jacalin-related lectin 2-like [Hibiscus syriacus]KAE8714233.1 hypothetical protein F3Y22_tig00110198pilonHSYRG00046 [Hibiscus syriacus]
MSFPEMIKVGPVGNDRSGGEWDEKGNDRIIEIYISYCSYYIASLQFKYVNPQGMQVLSRLHGISNGSHFNVVKLNSSEYLTGVKGKCCFHIESLTFITNAREFGPFGAVNTRSREFNFQFGLNRRFGGFFGHTKNGCLTSIGAYLKTRDE